MNKEPSDPFEARASPRSWGTAGASLVHSEAPKRHALDEPERSEAGYDSIIQDMDDGELLELRARIEARMPDSLPALNLERELVHQYLRVKALQERTLSDDRVPHNQRAQVAGQVAATLQHLVKMQSEWNTSERLKEIESRLIKCLNLMPEETVQEFFKWYASEGQPDSPIAR